MIRRIVVVAGAVSLITVAVEAVPSAKGTVEYIDPEARVVYFQDGRVVHVEPGTTFTVDGRAVSIEELLASAGTPVATMSHPPIGAAGTVAAVDTRGGLITFQDGRAVATLPRTAAWQPVRLVDGTMGWQPVKLTVIRPGMQVFVWNVQPLGTRQSVAASPHVISDTDVVPASVVVAPPAPAAPVVTPADVVGKWIELDRDEVVIQRPPEAP
jgi:hypothetical protein